MKTLVVYSPEAKPDIQKWLERRKIKIKITPVIKLNIKDDEEITIMEKSKLNKIQLFDKLVLYGQFTETDLHNLVIFACALN